MTKKTPEAAVSTAEALIKDLTGILASEAKAKGALDKAKANAEGTTNSSLRAIATRLAGINEDLDKEQMKSIAQSVAERLAGGNEGVLKARKSEMLLMLEQRAAMLPLIEGYDKLIEEKRAKDPKFSLNIRSKVLTGLRAVRNDNVTPATVIRRDRESMEHVAKPAEVAERLLNRLLDCGAYSGYESSDREKKKKLLDDRAVTHIEALLEIAKAGPDIDGTAKRMREAQHEEVTAGIGAVLGVDTSDLAAELAETELDAVTAEEPEAPAAAPTADDDDLEDLDFDSVIGGVSLNG